MLENGEKKLQEFISKRINSHELSLKATVKNNTDNIFTSKAAPSKNQQQIRHLKTNVALFARLFIASQNRSGDLDEFFSYENQGIPPALSLNGELRSGQKADLLKVFADKFPDCCSTETPVSDCHIIDGPALVNIYKPQTTMTFQNYANKIIIPRLEFLLLNSTRVDVVFDIYLDTSLKNATRFHRGTGSRRRVLSHLRVPKNWNSFLRHSDNKTELFAYLASHIHLNLLQCLMLALDQDISLIALCNHEEADTRLFVHANDALTRQSTKGITIHTVDTDVVVLAIASSAKHPELDLKVAFGSSLTYYDTGIIKSMIGIDRALAVLMFHSLSRCDTVSFVHRTAYSLWETHPEITEVFIRVMKKLVHIQESDFNALELYFVHLYDRTSETVRVSELRKRLYTKGKSIESIPPTQSALHEHIRRSAYQANVWHQLKWIQELYDISLCGWTKSSDRWDPLWSTLPGASAF